MSSADLDFFENDPDTASYVDDTTLYTVKEINALETLSQKLFKCFNNNFMKANSDKSHLLLSCNETFTPSSSIEKNTKEVLLEITIDKDLKFDDHINSPCKKACQKFNALAHLAPYMNVEKEG